MKRRDLLKGIVGLFGFGGLSGLGLLNPAKASLITPVIRKSKRITIPLCRRIYPQLVDNGNNNGL